MKHTGRAVVFENIEDFHARIDDERSTSTRRCVMVLKNCGPKGYPGMAEVGNMPLPPKLLKQGVTDMVRISDARMSGTAYGTVVLHTAPEAAAGGPLALVQNGDMIELDVDGAPAASATSTTRSSRARRAAWKPPAPHGERGYVKLYVDHVLQANDGADLDFLVGRAAPPCRATTTDTSVATALLLAASTGCAIPTADADADAQLALDYVSFDARRDRYGWRTLSASGCTDEAVALLTRYASANDAGGYPPKRGASSRSMPDRRWRSPVAMPSRSCISRRAQDAAALTEWRVYVAATLAFLRRDAAALDAARSAYAAAAGDSMRLRIIDGFIARPDASYRVAAHCRM